MKFLHEYSIFANGVRCDNGYWEIDGDYLYNRAGGRHDYNPKPDDEIIEADGWDEIIRMTVRDDSETTGWIAPDGEFFGCSPRDHRNMAVYLFGMEEDELEEKGYLKIFENPNMVIINALLNGEEPHRYEAYVRRYTTEAQRETLAKKGLKEKPRSPCWYM